MLQSLEIKNYRSLKYLKLPLLGQINLVTGKNNTGKSTLLEAISLYASKCDFTWIYHLLNERGENYGTSNVSQERYSISKTHLNLSDENVKTFSSLFNNRLISFAPKDAITVEVTDDNLLTEQLFNEKSISIRFVKYKEETEFEGIDVVANRRIRKVIDEELIKNVLDTHLGLEIRDGMFTYIIPLEEKRPVRYTNFKDLNSQDKFQFIRTRNIDRDINGKLWDEITLTEKEAYVIEALKIIEPNIDRLAFVEDRSRDRTAVVKIKNEPQVRPLKSMGDGINRILTIILALVNGENGFLLIDEFENGLHYSVQEQLWGIIFKIAKTLNVQVFATTHSEDCIKAFGNVLNNYRNDVQGELIRLNNINGRIQQTEFNVDELNAAVNFNIETR
jgi:AAA15 family ATPase/GTPase